MINNLKMALFVYDFPHRKCQDFMYELHYLGIRPYIVFAAPWKDLGIPISANRTNVKDNYHLHHPCDIAKAFGWHYMVIDHNSESISDTPGILCQNNVDFALVAGARILKQRIIDKFRLGVINVHPGLIPENRGLDAMLWAVLRNYQQGCTGHLVDNRIDAGIVLKRNPIPIYYDDTLFDVAARLYQTQIKTMVESVAIIANGEQNKGTLIGSGYEYHSKMTPKLELDAIHKWPYYRKEWCT